MVFMEAAIPYPYSQLSQGVGYDVYHAVLVICSVLLGWKATGVLFRNLTEKKDGKEESGLSMAETWLTILAPWCVGSSDSLLSLFNEGKQDLAQAVEEQDHADELAYSYVRSSTSSSPAMSLLEHYGVFGAPSGAWSSDVGC